MAESVGAERAVSRSQPSFLLLRLVGLAMIYVSALAFLELYEVGNTSGSFIGNFSLKWFTGMLAFSILAGLVVATSLAVILRPGQTLSIYDRSMVHRLPRWIRYALAGALVLMPSIILLGEWGRSLTSPAFRALLLSTAGITAGLIIAPSSEKAVSRIAISFLASAAVFAGAKRLVLLTDYPFKLFWSEGNRLWDYSLYYALDRYQLAPGFTLPSYMAPGRHGLWGLPYLIPGIGISLVRLWDHLLWLVPYFLLGWLFFSPKRVPIDRLLRVGLALWSLLYFSQGGIFAPLILSAVILAWGFDSASLRKVAVTTALATFYAGISRWTWMVAPAIYGSLWMLLDDPAERPRPQRIRQAVIVGLFGLAGGVASQTLLAILSPRPDPIFSTALDQPLLWYRLLPNATNPQGILLELLLAAGPLLALLIWLGRSRWGWLEWGAVSLGLISTLAVGLTASVKIGGGNNIHNLDMFLLLVYLAVGWAGMNLMRGRDWNWRLAPIWARSLAVLAIVLPALSMIRTGGPPRIPSEDDIQRALQIIREEIGATAGEILFIDHRHLLTFGQVEEVELTGDYELKDMMNQAMRANSAYFKAFTDDLERHRFGLIVSDPIPKFVQGSDFKFGEENDAWFHFVAGPLQEFYEPLHDLDEVQLMIMVPKR